MNFYNENDPRAAAWLRELIKEKLIPDGHVETRSITDIRASDLAGFVQCHFFCGIAGWSEALRLADWPANKPVWTGSCPCQPFSVAGKGRGEDDERHLWPAFFNLIRECRPQFVFGEQVDSAIGHGWLDGIRTDLEGEGYACGHPVLGAHSLLAPQKRQRLYWVADADKERWDRLDALLRRDECGREQGDLLEAAGGGEVDGMAYTDAARPVGRAASAVPKARPCARPASGGSFDGMANAKSERESPVAGSTREGILCPAGDSGNPGPLVQPISPRLEGHAGNGDNGHQPGRLGTEQAGPTSASGDTGFWSDSTPILCSDGKYRRIPTEPDFQSMASRIPIGMGDSWASLSSELKQRIETYAAAIEAHPRQALRTMLQNVREEDLPRSPRGACGVSPAAVLLFALRELERAMGPVPEGALQGIHEGAEGEMLSLWERAGELPATTRPSQGRELEEQCQRQFGDFVYVLSHESAQFKKACALAYGMTGFPLASRIPYKMARRRSICAALLSGSGNSIVPQVAAEFIKAFLEARELTEEPTSPQQPASLI